MMMRLKMPVGTTYHWNPYSPKYYTILASGAPISPTNGSLGSGWNSGDEGSARDGDEYEEQSPSMSNRYLSVAGTPTALSRVSSAQFLPPALGAAEIRPTGAAIIAHIRSFPSDNLIEAQMAALNMTERELIVDALAADPCLVPELCLSARGNILAQVLSALSTADPRRGALLQYLLNNFDHLAYHQNGTIALIRLYEVAGASFAADVNVRAVERFRALSLHQYGNFVVSRVVRSICSSNFTSVPDRCVHQLQSLLGDPAVVLELATSKFGSHVLEAWTDFAPLRSFLKTANLIVHDRMLLASLGYHPVANYPLQGILRRLAHEPHHLQNAVTDAANFLADSPYSVNIRKAVRGQLSRKKEATRGGMPMPY